MPAWMLLLHLVAACIWLGGMTLMLWAVRPAALAVLAPPQRVRYLADVLRRFFQLVWVCIAVLLATGLPTVARAEKTAPGGWLAMALIGILMSVIFAFMFGRPFRALQQAVAREDWPAGGAALARMHPLVLTNTVLGWIAVAAVRLWP
jgi:uncharacterized membrane protein